MFSGIIEKLGKVGSAESRERGVALVLETGFADLELGESVAVNGVCLTVADLLPDGAAGFFASAETVSRSNLGRLAAGDVVNLERALRLDTRLSGHLVQGHVDGKARLASVAPESGAFVLEFALPSDLARYCVEKGSITLNGISLTLNKVVDERPDQSVIGITIIPHTWKHTNLHASGIGDEVNVEVDVIAKYVERLCQPYQKS
jgi:riboflavin synthase